MWHPAHPPNGSLNIIGDFTAVSVQMTIQITEFKVLREANDSWPALRAAVEAAGMNVRLSGQLAIIHYKRADDLPAAARWWRSVVWDTVRNVPLSVSTPRAEQGGAEQSGTEQSGAEQSGAEQADLFTWQAADFTGKNVSEYLEGVSLNIFKDADGNVHVASRTRIGAGTGFYSKTTFQQMLADAVAAAGYSGGSDSNSSIEEFFKAQTAGTQDTFLTVLVKHPEHRVVEKVEKPQLFILQQGHVADDGTVAIRRVAGYGAPPLIAGPVAGQSVAAWFEALVSGNTWAWQGVVVQDSEGRRWRMRSAVYHMIRSLRGNTSRADERFFTLRAAGMVKTYLQYFPEESDQFWAFEKWIRSTTKHLYNLYVSIYKAKQFTLGDVEAQWHTHLAALCRLYMGTLKPAKKSVLLENVVEYMNALPVPRLLFLMNYWRRGGAAVVAAVAAVAEAAVAAVAAAAAAVPTNP